MALIRTNRKEESQSYLLWIGMHTTGNSAFYNLDGTLNETTGGTFSNKNGISVTYGSSDSFSVTNHLDVPITYMTTTGSAMTVTVSTIAAGATASLTLPTLIIPA